MIQSIRSLEEEIKSLKHNTTLSKNYTNQSAIVPSPPSISLSNSFEALATISENDIKNDDFITVNNRKKKITKTNKTPTQYRNSKTQSRINKHKKVHVPHRNVTVVGDSHCRGLAALMAPRTYNQTKITGICKPGAGLLTVAPASTPPDQHAYVVIVGTNDVADGRQDIIFKHMENLITKCTESSRVLVSPLTPRYDLPPTSPVHENIVLVNHFISELCCRHERVKMLDLSDLGRNHFTRHGLHLNAAGKNLLADLIIKELAQTPSHSRQRFPARKTASTPPCLSPRCPNTLQHETYAEAVTKGPSKRPRIQRTSLPRLLTDAATTENCDNISSFLGTPLVGDGVN